MPKPELVEMPSKKDDAKKIVSVSFRFDAKTRDRIKAVKAAAQSVGAKKLNLDEHIESKVHQVLDSIEIILSDHGHPLDEALTKKKQSKKSAATNRTTTRHPTSPTEDQTGLPL